MADGFSEAAFFFSPSLFSVSSSIMTEALRSIPHRRVFFSFSVCSVAFYFLGLFLLPKHRPCRQRRRRAFQQLLQQHNVSSNKCRGLRSVPYHEKEGATVVPLSDCQPPSTRLPNFGARLLLLLLLLLPIATAVIAFDEFILCRAVPSLDGASSTTKA